MARGSDIETLRDLFSRDKTSVGIGEVVDKSLAVDGSVLRLKIELFPDKREVIVRRAWPGCGPGAGIFFPVTVGDLAVVVFADNDEDTGFMISHISSKIDKIPLQVMDDHLVLKALLGKKIMMGGAGDIEPLEPMVLGLILKTLLSSVLSELTTLSTALAVHTHTAPGTPPGNAAAITASGVTFGVLKGTPVDDGLMNSNVIFGEKGI